jgi:hypothetical protein
MLIQMLEQQFNVTLRSNAERHFICRRLALLDQWSSLDADLTLKQAYLETSQEVEEDEEEQQQQNGPVRLTCI